MHRPRSGISGAVLAVGLITGLSVGAVRPPRTEALGPPHAHLVSDDPADATPHILDSHEYPPIAGESKVKVNAVLPMGDRVYVGGTFTGVRNDNESKKFPRSALFALDALTHKVDAVFDPVLDGAVERLAPSPDGQSLFVGGSFTTVDGQSVPRLAKLDAVTGAPLASFRPAPSAQVKDLALVDDDRLVLAGPFSTVAGERRGGLAIVDVVTGALSPELDIDFREPRQGSISRVEAVAVTPDGNTLVAGGNFTEAGGEERWQLALVDITPGREATLIDWHTDRFNDNVVTRKSDDVPACAGAFDAHVKDLAMSPDGSYFVVVTTGGYTARGPLCDTASRWETDTRGEELQPTWANYTGGDTLTGVAITGATVYVGGHVRWMNNFDNAGSSADAESGPGSVEREGLAALDPESGLPLPWNPRRERGHGPEAIVAATDGLWVGSDTNFVGHRDFGGTPRRGEYHSKLAFFPLAGGRALPHFNAPDLPADLYAGGEDGVQRLPFDGTRLGEPTAVDSNLDWSEVRGGFTVGDFLYTGTSDGELLRRRYDGSRFGAAQVVDRRGMTSSHFPIEDVTGMFYDRGRLYFTIDGEEELHYRYFLPQPDIEDDIIGDNQPFLTATGNDDIDWSDVAGLLYADGHIYWSEDGDLYRVAFTRGAISGSRTLVAAGAGLDARALFLMPPTTSPPPTSTTTANTTTTTSPPPDDPGGTTTGSGYWMVASGGGIFNFSDREYLGSLGADPPERPVVAVAPLAG